MEPLSKWDIDLFQIDVSCKQTVQPDYNETQTDTHTDT